MIIFKELEKRKLKKGIKNDSVLQRLTDFLRAGSGQVYCRYFDVVVSQNSLTCPSSSIFNA
jgi:hypothetical protein